MEAIGGGGIRSLPAVNLFAGGGAGLAQGALKLGCSCGTAGCPGCGGGSLRTPSAGTGQSAAPSPSIDTRAVLANADGGTIGSLIQAQEASGGTGEGGFDPANPDGLSEEEEEVVRDLKQRDQEVRRHEQAHAAVGGQYASAPTYEYTTGPDGQRYAVGGEVQIDVSPIDGDPEATIQKMDQVIAAALAPAEPSGQDRAVASQAQAQKQAAQAELSAERRDELSGESEEGGETEIADGADAAAGPDNGPGDAAIERGDGVIDGVVASDRGANPFRAASDLFEAAGGLTRGDRPGSGLNLFA